MTLSKIYMLFFIFILFLCSCGETANRILKETPQAPNLSGYNTIYVGWIDFPEADASLYGFKDADWKTEIKRQNIEGLQVYMRENLPGKKIIGSTSRTDKYVGNADIQLQFKLNGKIKNNGQLDCELPIDVTMLDGKNGKVLYSVTMVVTCAFTHDKRNWKNSSFDGALDNELYKLAAFIAQKLK